MFVIPISFAHSGAGKEPAPPESIGLEEVPGLLHKADELVESKVDALISTVDSEVKAKRLAPSVALSLRSFLRNTNASTEINAQTLFTNTNLPMENDAVAKAVDGLGEGFHTAQRERAAIFRQALAGFEKRLAKLTLSAKSPAEVDPVLAAVAAVQEAAAKRVGSNPPALQMNSLANRANFLRALRRVLETQPSDDAAALLNTLRQFQWAGQSLQDFLVEDVVRKRIASALEPLKNAAATTQSALVDALTGEKPYADVSSALAAFVEAAKRYSTAGDLPERREAQALGESTKTYQLLASIAQSREMHQWSEVRQGLANARPLIHYLDARQSRAFNELLARWDREVRETTETAARVQREQLRAKLSEVKKPADLEAIAAGIAKIENEPRQNPEAGFIQGLSGRLSTLAAAWSGRDAASFAGQGSMGRPSAFASELAEIESRIERDLLAESLHAPELKQPPLADQPLGIAFDNLVEKLSASAEWRRLLQILEGRDRAPGKVASISRWTTAISSVRSFLAGQNFEQAGQWTDAAAAYKTVLRNSSECSPIKEAAARLKAIAQKHPKEAKAAQPVPLEDVRR